MKQHKITTNNKEVYEKFNMLNFSSEVLIKSDKNVRLNKILKALNKNGNVVSCEQVGKYLLIKKVNPILFNIYLSEKSKHSQQKIKKNKTKKNIYLNDAKFISNIENKI